MVFIKQNNVFSNLKVIPSDTILLYFDYILFQLGLHVIGEKDNEAINFSTTYDLLRLIALCNYCISISPLLLLFTPQNNSV